MRHSHRPIHHGHHDHHTPPPLLFPARRRLLANANSRIAPSARRLGTSLRPCSGHAPPTLPDIGTRKQQTRISQTTPQDRKHTCAPERAAEGAAPPATAPNGKPGGPGPMRQRSRPRITWRTAASLCALVSAPALSLCTLYSSVFRRMTVAGRTVPRRPQTAPQRHSHASLVWQRPFRSVSRLRCALFALVVLFATLLWRCAVLFAGAPLFAKTFALRVRLRPLGWAPPPLSQMLILVPVYIQGVVRSRLPFSLSSFLLPQIPDCDCLFLPHCFLLPLL